MSVLAQVKEGIAAALQRAAEELTAEGRGDLPPAEAVADSVEAAMFNLYGALPLPCDARVLGWDTDPNPQDPDACIGCWAWLGAGAKECPAWVCTCRRMTLRSRL